MTTVTYYFNSVDSAYLWTDLSSNAVDGDETTFAASNVMDDLLWMNGNTCPGTDLGDIYKVEFRAMVSYAGDSGSGIDFYPVFTAGVGNQHGVPTNATYWTSWMDITNDTNAPSTWTWADVVALDMQAYAKPWAGTTADYVKLAKVEIQVSYAIALTATDITTGAPSIGIATIKSNPILSTSTISAGTPTIGSPTLYHHYLEAYTETTGDYLSAHTESTGDYLTPHTEDTDA